MRFFTDRWKLVQILFFIILSNFSYAEFAEYAPYKNISADVKIKPVGRIREDFFFYKNPFLFGNDPDDTFWYMRSRVELGLHAQYGKSTFGEIAAESVLRFKAYNFWQSSNAYNREEPIVVRSSALDGAAVGDSHAHTTFLPHVFLDEAWLKINFGTLYQAFKAHPISLTIGYFPYELGRGVALGWHEDLANTSVGWRGEFGATRFPMMPPGILLRGKLSDSCSWDIYYNKWRANNGVTENVFSPVYQNRLNWNTIYRGKDKDRDTVAARVDFKVGVGEGALNLQPYFSYTRAPELPIEFEADSKARLGTVGFMTDWSHPRFDFNLDVAGQFGSHTVFAFDRNQVVLQRDANGNVKEWYSHIRLGNAETGEKAPVTSTISQAANLPINRESLKNGAQLLTQAGVPLVHDGQAVVNSNLWGQPRIRKASRVNYAGLMGLVDAAYKFENTPLKAAAALGYIGGDAYPFNTENGGDAATALQSNQSKDKTYKGFIAQRAAYVGKEVHSLIVFERQVLQRPTSFINALLYADNNYRDYSNLMFAGTNVVWYPLKEKKKLTVEPNVIGFWEASAPQKWDKNARHPNARIQRLLEANGITGWLSDKKASPFLGTELNVIMNYEIFKNCAFYFKGWLFAPGQLYRDLEGQPNRAGRRKDVDGKTFFITQGSRSTTGFYTGFDYKF